MFVHSLFYSRGGRWSIFYFMNMKIVKQASPVNNKENKSCKSMCLLATIWCALYHQIKQQKKKIQICSPGRLCYLAWWRWLPVGPIQQPPPCDARCQPPHHLPSHYRTIIFITDFVEGFPKAGGRSVTLTDVDRGSWRSLRRTCNGGSPRAPARGPASCFGNKRERVSKLFNELLLLSLSTFTRRTHISKFKFFIFDQ